jgi:hypothetical protein
MINLNDLTTGQLQCIVAIEDQIEILQGQMDSVPADVGTIDSPPPFTATNRRRRMPITYRASIAADPGARWDKAKRTEATASEATKKRKRLSSAFSCLTTCRASHRSRKSNGIYHETTT